MKNLHIVVPDLFAPPAAMRQLMADLPLPSLAKCLARAERQRLPRQSLSDYLARVFGVATGAVAPVTWLADGGTLANNYCLRADPVHLNAQPSRMIVQTNLHLSEVEAAQICASLNAHFAQDGLFFSAPHPSRWYVRLQKAQDLMTYSIDEVDGRDARQFQAKGADALRWAAILTEIQMLLCVHPVNQQRAERGELALNSLWFWGGGFAAKSTGSIYAQVAGDAELLKALADFAGVSQVSFSEPLAVGATLWVWDGLAAAIRRGDYAAWRASLVEFENNCMLPALLALQRRELQNVQLDVLQDEHLFRFILTRGSVYKVWRRAVSLAQFVSS